MCIACKNCYINACSTWCAKRVTMSQIHAVTVCQPSMRRYFFFFGHLLPWRSRPPTPLFPPNTPLLPPSPIRNILKSVHSCAITACVLFR